MDSSSADALTGCMTPLVVIGWAALATAINIGTGRWCRAADARPTPAAAANR